MKRFLRAAMVAVLFLLGGAVVTTLVAEGIGYLGIVVPRVPKPKHFVAVEGRVAEVRDIRGTGWCLLDWTVEDEGTAAYSQYIYERPMDLLEAAPIHPQLRCEPLDSLPAWGGFRRPEKWSAGTTAAGGAWFSSASDLAAGWPFFSFSLDLSASTAVRVRGGTMLQGTVAGGRRMLFWRPLMPGFLLDSLLWGACLALIAWPIRALIRRRRRTTGGCVSCGYDLRGLSPAAACPECGGARAGAAGAVG